MESRRGDEPGSGGLRIGHGVNLRLDAEWRQALFGTKSNPHPYPSPAPFRFAIADTIPTIPISPMDLPMESSRPKTR
jgi:hypothetical protein